MVVGDEVLFGEEAKVVHVQVIVLAPLFEDPVVFGEGFRTRLVAHFNLFILKLISIPIISLTRTTAGFYGSDKYFVFMNQRDPLGKRSGVNF